MKIRGGSADEAEVPLAAMIDVVFLLLIFFILTFREQITEAHVTVAAPLRLATKQPAKTPNNVIDIRIAGGQYWLMGSTALPLEELVLTIATMSRYDPDQSIVVRVHQDAKHAELIALLDHCRRHRLQKINVLPLRG